LIFWAEAMATVKKATMINKNLFIFQIYVYKFLILIFENLLKWG
jgi:hypothetical protein